MVRARSGKTVIRKPQTPAQADQGFPLGQPA